MILPALITTDLHLTANPRDEYRWGLFPWLKRTGAKNNCRSLAILGDLTDAKDYHPAELVNRIVATVYDLLSVYERIYILCGNHDYLRGGHAFFAFLSNIPAVTFITTTFDSSSEGESVLWLPHTKTPMTSWAGMDFSAYRFVFMHQTVSGSIASNGQKMDGDAFPDMSAAGKVYSGDIHVPQVIGGVEYVGSPYHVHFGDAFRPRCVLLDERGEAFDQRFRTINRVTLNIDAATLDSDMQQSLVAGDQVKLRVHLQPSEMHEWSAIRREVVKVAKGMGADVCGVELITPARRRSFTERGDVVSGITDAESLEAYVHDLELGGDSLQTGLELL